MKWAKRTCAVVVTSLCGVVIVTAPISAFSRESLVRISSAPNWSNPTPASTAMSGCLSQDASSAFYNARATNIAPVSLPSLSSPTKNFLFRYDLAAAANEWISTSPTADYTSGNCDLSSDGRYIAFFGYNEYGLAGNAYVHDLTAHTTELASARNNGTALGRMGEGSELITVLGGGISANGLYALFSARGTTAIAPDDSNAITIQDAYRRNLTADTTELVSKSAVGGGTNGNSLATDIAGDGSLVVLASDATNLGPSDTNGGRDIYLKNMNTGAVELVSTKSDGSQVPGSATNGKISSDNRYLAFDTTQQLVDEDTNGTADIYLRDLQTNQVEWLSRGLSGTGANSAVSLNDIDAAARNIVFSTAASNIVAGDTNGHTDTFVYDRDTDAASRASLTYNGGQANTDVTGTAISANGSTVMLSTTATNMIAGGTAGRNIYLASTTHLAQHSLASTGQSQYLVLVLTLLPLGTATAALLWRRHTRKHAKIASPAK